VVLVGRYIDFKTRIVIVKFQRLSSGHIHHLIKFCEKVDYGIAFSRQAVQQHASVVATANMLGREEKCIASQPLIRHVVHREMRS